MNTADAKTESNRVPPVSPFVIQAYRKRSGDPHVSIEAERHAVALYDALACAEAEREQYRASGIRQWEEFRLSEQRLRDEIATERQRREKAEFEKAEQGRNACELFDEVKRLQIELRKAEERFAHFVKPDTLPKTLDDATTREWDLARDLDIARRELAEARKTLENLRDALPMKEFVEDHDPVAAATFKRIYGILDAAREAGKGQS